MYNMFSATVTVTMSLILGCYLAASVQGRANQNVTRLEEPCRVQGGGDTGSTSITDNISSDNSLHLTYENVQHTAEHGADLVTTLKEVYYADRNVEEVDLQDMMMFMLRDLPEVSLVNLGDLEEANTTTFAHELYRQVAHASKIVKQSKLDEMNLEANEGFRQDFHNLEDQLYSLLCHLKVTLMHHNEDIQHSVVAEVLRLPYLTLPFHRHC